MSIYLIRHGETALNAARVIQPADTPLSARGLQQADALARRIAALGVAAIVSSDLPRAWRTAEAIAAVTGPAVGVSALLAERNFGALRGHPYDTLGFDPLAMDDAPPGGESTAAFERRVAEPYSMVVALRSTLGGPLAVVTHGLVIRAILRAHTTLATRPDEVPVIGNTALTVLGARPPHTIALLACTHHLDAGPGNDPHSLSGG